MCCSSWFLVLLFRMAAMFPFNDGPLRICLFVEPSPITYVSGYANRFQALLRYLSHQKDHVELTTVELVHPQAPSEWLNIPIHYTRGIRFPCYPVMSISIDWTFQMWRIVHRVRPHFIHVTSPGWMVFSVLPLSRLYQIPLVISYHTHLPVYLNSYLPRGIRRVCVWMLWKLLFLVHRLADLTVVTSPQIQKELQSHGIPAQVWQKGIDSQRFHPRHCNETMRRKMSDNHVDDFLIVTIGRLASEKRIKDLKGVLNKLPNVRLCIVGEGPQQKELWDYFYNTKTVFTGQLTGEELCQAFASADVFCMPSDSETLGFAILESMASAVPVIGVAAGGIPDIIDDGQTGYLVDPGDINSMVDRIRRLQQNPQLRADMASRARQDTEKWTWEASMSRLRNEQYLEARKNFHNRVEQRLWRLFTFKKKAYN